RSRARRAERHGDGERERRDDERDPLHSILHAWPFSPGPTARGATRMPAPPPVHRGDRSGSASCGRRTRGARDAFPGCQDFDPLSARSACDARRTPRAHASGMAHPLLPRGVRLASTLALACLAAATAAAAPAPLSCAPDDGAASDAPPITVEQISVVTDPV